MLVLKHSLELVDMLCFYPAILKILNQDPVSVKMGQHDLSLYICTCTLQGVPNGWERVPLSNPLGFKHHQLEGAGISNIYTYICVVLIYCNQSSLYIKTSLHKIKTPGHFVKTIQQVVIWDRREPQPTTCSFRNKSWHNPCCRIRLKKSVLAMYCWIRNYAP